MTLLFIVSAAMSAGAQTLDSFNPNADLPVYQALKLPDGKILICGNVTKINGVTTGYLARLNPDGSRDASFVSPNPSSVVGQIIPLPDGKFMIVGSFDLVGGVTRRRIARLNADFTVDESFEAGITTGNGVGRAEIMPDGRIIIGISNSFSRGLYRLNIDGSFDNSFNELELNGPASRIVYDPTIEKMYVIGGFSIVNGESRSGIVRLNLDGSVDTSFQPVAMVAGIPFGVDPQPDGKVYLIGTFQNVGGETGRNHIVRLNSDGTVDTTFATVTLGAGINGGLYDLEVLPSGKLLIAGAFPTVNGVDRMNMARLNSDGTLDQTFRNMIVGTTASNFNGPGYLDDLGDGHYFVGGSFTSIDGQTRNRIASIWVDDETAVSNTDLDFDGDGKADPAIFRPGTGVWWQLNSTAGVSAAPFGISTDLPVPADYDADGKTDRAVFRSGIWWISRSSDGQNSSVAFGLGSDVPAPADYDGDGIADVAVFRPTNGEWWILMSNDGLAGLSFGQAGDVPMRGDYDGDGKNDIAVYRPANNFWYVLRSSDGQVAGNQFGTSGDIPLSGDFNGDGKSDLSVFRPSNGVWYIARPTGEPAQNFDATQFGGADDIPAPADYDGDGETDIAIYRSGVWWVLQSSGSVRVENFGVITDRVISGFYPE